MNRNTLKLLNHLIAWAFFGSIVYISTSNLHLKTLYQSFFNLILLTIVCAYFLKKKRNEAIPLERYYWLFYWIIVASVVNSIAENYYKLGRYYFDVDFFRFLPALIPLYFFVHKKDWEDQSKGMISFHFVSIFVLSSISYSFLFSEYPEVCLLFFYPLIHESFDRFSLLFVKKNFVFFVLFLFFINSLVFGFSSQHFLTYLFLYLLIFFLYCFEFEIKVSFLLILLVCNLLEVLIRNYLITQEFVFFYKDGSSILNSNRVAAYTAIQIPLLLAAIKQKFNKVNFVYLISVSILVCFVLLNQFSRASVFGVLIVLGTYLLFLQLKKDTFIYFLYFLCPLVFLIHFSPIIVTILASPNIEIYEYLNQLSSGRLELWEIYFTLFNNLSLPQKIFGLGIGEHNFLLAYLPKELSTYLMQFATKADGSYLHTHNLPSTILFYSGFFGFISYILLILYYFYRFLIQKDHHENRIWCLLAVLYFLIHNAFDMLVDVYGFMLLFAYLLKVREPGKQEKTIFNCNQISKISFVPLFFCLVIYGYFLCSRIYFKNEFFTNNALINQNFDQNASCKLVRFPERKPSETKYNISLNWNPFFVKDFPSYRYSQEIYLFQLSALGNEANKPEVLNIKKRFYKECKRNHFRPVVCEMNSTDDKMVPYSGIWLSDIISDCTLE